MKRLNKLFPITLLPLVTLPVLFNGTNVKQTNNDKTVKLNNKNDASEESMRCTITYVGKECSTSGLPIIARATDASPRTALSALRKYYHNQRANEVLKNINGFEYKLPSTTYSYICAPDSPKTDGKAQENQFENFGINEMGVGLSCTLTCYTNSLAESADNFVTTGINEEMFNQVIIPQANSARHAMEIAADVIKTHGSAEPNIIMSIDQNEAWLMEIYTGHQFCAIKMPQDKVCVGGNEFLLNTLDELGINASNVKENCIMSDDLLNLPQLKSFAKYDDSHIEDVYHLHLFNTYARPLSWVDPQSGEVVNTDGCHMRTWRGYSLFAPNSEEGKTYGYNTKYKPFFTPERKLSTIDVKQVYRDEYDDILDPTSSKYDPYFKRVKDNGDLRCIAAETTRSIHIMTSSPDLPKELAVNMWYCAGSSNYTPFVLLNNGIESITNEYAYWPERYQYDENCSSVLFRKLNTLGWIDRTNYGLPLQPLWEAFEHIYGVQSIQVLNDASKLKKMSDTKNIITNFNNHVRKDLIDAVKYVTSDLMLHIMNDAQATPAKRTLFHPLVDLVTYLTNLGWTDFAKSGNIITFRNGDVKGKLDIGEGYFEEMGTITIGDKTEEIEVEWKDNKVFVDFEQLNKLIEGKTTIKTININDYLDKFNHWIWAGPVIAITLIGGGIAIYFLLKKKKGAVSYK